MRTTLDIQDELIRDARKLAAETGQTLKAVIEDALRELMARSHSANGKKEPIVLPTFGSGGLMPGVDLDNSAALLELMDKGDGSV